VSVVRAAVVLLLPFTVLAQRAPVFTRADTARLHRTLDSLAGAHHGIVGYAVHNLDTGEQLALRGDSTFPTASLIKVTVLVSLFDLVEHDSMSLDDPIRVQHIDKVPGSGILQYLQDNAEVTVRDAAFLMSTVSDNTATNLLLDKIGIRRVWKKTEALGLPHTKIHAKVFKRSTTTVAPDSSEKYGLGVTTPNEMARLFELMARGQAVSPRADSAMLDILANNMNGNMLQRYVPDVRFAHKDGEDDDTRTECGLFWLQSRVVICVLTKANQDQRWLLDNEPQLLLANIGRVVVAAWPPAVANKTR
jgi:beta-lactamase class A